MEVQAAQLATVLEPQGSIIVLVKGDNGVLREISKVILVKGDDELLPDNPASPDKIVIELVEP